MREFFKNLYYKSTLGRALIHPLIRLRNTIIPQEVLLKQRFKRMLGYSLNLSQPKSFNEKIQWLKLHDRSPLHVKCADKFAVREHIKEKIGEEYLIPLIFSAKNVDEINPDQLPDFPIIIKSNHGSGGVFIIRDKARVNWEEIKTELRKQLRQKYDDSKVEWQYSAIEPRFVIEKLLLDKAGSIPSDYKLHCLNGKVRFIQVDMDRETDHKKNLYDEEWNFIDCRFNYDNGSPVEKPAQLNKMIAIAEKLAKDFIYVRVDLYNIEDKIYFGELTFHPASGFGKFEPIEWDYKFGEMLQLPL